MAETTDRTNNQTARQASTQQTTYACVHGGNHVPQPKPTYMRTHANADTNEGATMEHSSRPHVQPKSTGYT